MIERFNSTKKLVRRLCSCVAAWWYCLQGLYLQCGGEKSCWLMLRGEHHLFHGIRFRLGAVQFIDAESGAEVSTNVSDDFGEQFMLTDSDEVVRLVSAGTGRATLIHTNGSVEELRANRYGTEVYRHGVVRYVQRRRIGGALFETLSSGHLLLDGTPYDLSSHRKWEVELPNGDLLSYCPHGQLLLRNSGRTFAWDKRRQRLLEVDYHRKELNFAWATAESESPTPILDGLLTIHPEDASIQIMHHSVFSRGEEIDWHGPNGLRITRENNSDTLHAFQNKTLIGVAEFVENGGFSAKSNRSYNRWRFSPGNAVREPVGNGWFSPAGTAAIFVLALAILASFAAGDWLAYLLASPVLLVTGILYIRKELRRGINHLRQP